MKTMMTLAAALAASTATAQITSEDDATFGVDSITRDAGQQLDFLDLTLSTNRSFNDVSTQFGSGGEFEGWRHATMIEVGTLATNWGFSPAIPQVNAPMSFPGDPGTLDGLVALLGQTATGNNSSLQTYTASIGVTGTDQVGVLQLTVQLRDFDDPGVGDLVGVSNIPDAGRSPASGHYLVRAVPAPSSAVLLGVAGLAATRRRR
ncbi:MAG: hypothetical protein AAFR96_03295 [Planctomycetota bacterium]